MSLIITPGQLAKRAEFYHQLGQLHSAGLGVVQALEQIGRNPPSAGYRAAIARTTEHIGCGGSFAEALQQSAGWLPDFDLALLHAGEQSGRLDQCFRQLAEYYQHRAKLARQMISQLMYPVGIVHFAVFIFQVVLPFAQSQFNASLALLFLRALLFLAPLYLAVAALVFAMQSKHGAAWRAGVEKVLHCVPMLGSARRQLALARLAAALEALNAAGVNIIQAWGIAATASSSPALQRVVVAWPPQFAMGRTPSELVRTSGVFPDMFSNLYTTGEVSGKLDESLKNLRQYYQEEGTRRLESFAELTPRVIYLVVALVIGYQIIRFYTGYFSQMQSMF
jgi:type II secretory pathway component PulF